MNAAPTDLADRIARFENMANADPTNDMAHFSLGGAYAQAGRHADAAKSYLRCVELNPEMSKAYQLAGASLIAAGQRKEAVATLTEGFTVAASKGDLMPRNAIETLLKQLDAPVPVVAGNAGPSSGGAASGGSSEGTFTCSRTGKRGTKLTEPPMRGPIGAWIVDNISAETWRAWIGQGTKVINELRLDFSKEADQQTYDKHMREFLGIDDELHARLAGSPASSTTKS